MGNNNNLYELIKAYHNYKKGNYTFGKYGTGEQIQRAFLDGKIFVLKGTIPRSVTLFCLFFVATAMIIISIIFASEEYFMMVLFSVMIGFFFAGFIPVLIFIIFMKRRFLVIGPSGVYYRNIKTGSFQWKNVYFAEAAILTTNGMSTYRIPTTTARVTIILPYQKKVRFSSEAYQNKEFVRKVRRLMFLRLFQIYAKLAKDTIKASGQYQEQKEPQINEIELDRIIFEFLKDNEKKAFTISSIINKISSEKFENITNELVEKSLEELIKKGKIQQTQKDNKTFYLY